MRLRTPATGDTTPYIRRICLTATDRKQGDRMSDTASDLPREVDVLEEAMADQQGVRLRQSGQGWLVITDLGVRHRRAVGVISNVSSVDRRSAP